MKRSDLLKVCAFWISPMESPVAMAELLSDAGRECHEGGAREAGSTAPEGRRDRLPLFEHLHAGHRVVPSGGEGETVARGLLVDADIILLGSDHAQPSAAIRGLMQEVADRPAVLACVSPFGSSGPLRDIAVNEFILQAMCGKLISTLGYDDDRAPVAAGGEPGLWLTGAYPGAHRHRLSEVGCGPRTAS